MPAQKNTDGRADISIALFAVAFVLILEGTAGRLAADTSGTDTRVLLALAGLVLAILGLLICLNHWSVAGLTQGTPHASFYGAIVLLGGLCFGALYTVELYAAVTLEQEDLLLVGIVETVVLLWLGGWLLDKWHRRHAK